MKVSDLRGILQYVPRFREKIFVVEIDGDVIASKNFGNILLDLAVLRSLNIKVVLVHGAAGGVGTALISSLGAAASRAMGTAGGPRKRAAVRAMGVEAVANSRDTTFVEALMQATRGEGVAAVLNSLTSAGMVAGTMAALGLGASYVEISKLGVWSAGRAAQERGDVAFSVMGEDRFSQVSMRED